VFVNQGEPADVVRRYLSDEDLALANVLLDGEGRLAKAIGVPGLPTTLFFDASGRLVDQRVGELSKATLAQRLEALRPNPALSGKGHSSS
jgi:thioredoxin-like negative regulator of GroEL